MFTAVDPTVTLAEGMGTLRGKEKMTVGNLGAEPKTFYRFSNIKYAHMVSDENRFKVGKQLISKELKLRGSVNVVHFIFLATHSLD